MRARRMVAIVAAVGAALTGVTAATAGAQSSSEGASDIGITADEIRIAVIADVDNAVRPGLFAGPVDAVRGFAEYVNSKGGIAGRELVVDFIDAHLSPDDARSALIRACEDDFAMIGTAALFINNVEPMVGCVDKAGAATGLPDIPSVTTETAHQCAPTSYPINPSQLVCATKDQQPQSWRANQGPIEFYQRTRERDLTGVGVYGNDVRPSVSAGRALIGGTDAAGVQIDDEIGISGLATQTEYAPIIQQVKSVDANFVVNASDYGTAVKIRREAKVQGVDAERVVWHCYSNCYNELLIEEGGDDVEGEYAVLNQVPFEETKFNKQLANYVKYTGKDDVDGFGAYAWIAGLLFRDAVNAVVEKSGENGITRRALLAELADVHRFDAGGMWGTTDIGGREPTPCFMLTQVKNGKFVRVYPKKKGTFDCKASNTVEFEADLLS